MCIITVHLAFILLVNLIRNNFAGFRKQVGKTWVKKKDINGIIIFKIQDRNNSVLMVYAVSIT